MNDTDLARRRQQLSPAKQALLAARLKKAQAQETLAATIPPRPDPSQAPLSIAQEALWAIHQIEPENPAYNRPFALQMSGCLELSALESAIGALLERQIALQAVFHNAGGHPLQTFVPPHPFKLSQTDLESLPDL